MDLVYLLLLSSAIALNVASAVMRRIAPCAFVALLGVVAYHFLAFFSGDYKLVLVFLNSAKGQTPLEDVAGALANIPGSAYIVALPISAYAVRRRGRLGPLAVALLLIYAGLERPFYTVSDYVKGISAESGIGLNPLLRSIWAVPHPLLVLAGYGLALATAIYGDLKIARLAWMSLSAGLALGALWSFETFGWSGYWAWDPVENALLAVWLALTAALHVKSRGAYVITSAVVMGAIAVNQGGFSLLHSFAGSGIAPAAFLATSFLLLSLGIFTLTKGADRAEPAVALVGYGMLGTSLLIYATVAVPAAASLLGLRTSPLSGDAFWTFLGPLLSSLAFSGLTLIGVYGAGKRRLVFAAYAAALAVSLMLTIKGLRISPESPLSTNFFVLLIIISSLISIIFLIKSNMNLLMKIIHILFLILLISISVSGPYAYNPNYYKLLPAVPGASYFTALSWPYPSVVAFYSVTYRLDPRTLELPPVGPLDLNPPNYTAYVSRIGSGFSLAGLQYEIADLDGVSYVIVRGGEGVEPIRHGQIPVVEVRRNGTAILFPAPLDLVEAVRLYPDAAANYLKCLNNSSSYAPGGIAAHVRLGIDGHNVTVAPRLDVSGAVRGVGGIVVGVRIVWGFPLSYVVLASPPMEFPNGSLTPRILLVSLYTSILLNECDPRAAYLVASLASGKPLNLTSLLAYTAARPQTWTIALKPVPLAALMWPTAFAIILAEAVFASRRILK